MTWLFWVIGDPGNTLHSVRPDSACFYTLSYQRFRCSRQCYVCILTLTTLKYLCINHGVQGVLQLKITINVLISAFRFIWIPASWAYGHYKYFNSFRAVIDFGRQILTSLDVRFGRRKTVPMLKRLSQCELVMQILHVGLAQHPNIYCIRTFSHSYQHDQQS